MKVAIVLPFFALLGASLTVGTDEIHVEDVDRGSTCSGSSSCRFRFNMRSTKTVNLMEALQDTSEVQKERTENLTEAEKLLKALDAIAQTMSERPFQEKSKTKAVMVTPRSVEAQGGKTEILTEAEKLIEALHAIAETMPQKTKTTDDNAIADSETSLEAVLGSTETGEENTEATRMQEDIAQINTAFKAAVTPSYDRMNGRTLWKELMKKQKKLADAKVQLQRLLDTKQAKFNKLHGKPAKYNIPSKDLSDTILSHIDEIVAYKPVNRNL